MPINGKLGKHPARHDARTLKLARYMTPQLPPPPASFDAAAAVTGPWGMFLNDNIGDCTIAGAAHMEMAWRANAGEVLMPDDNDILKAYEDVSGYTPGIPSTDIGAVELDVLKYWQKNGIAGRTIAAFASVDIWDETEVKQAISIFEGVYIGIQLPASAQSQDVWDAVTPESYASAPGTWGGHAVNVCAYDADGLTVVTWGQLKRMTWAFWHKYVDECYVILSPDELAGDKTPAGFDMDTLRANLAAIGNLPAQTPPVEPPPAGSKRLTVVMATGLGTDPTGDCWGMRAIAEKIAAAHSDYLTTIISVGWDTDPSQTVPTQWRVTTNMLMGTTKLGTKTLAVPSPAGQTGGYTSGPDGLSRYVKDLVAASRPTNVFGFFHSFGGAYGVFLMQWLWNWYSGADKQHPPFFFDLGVWFDPVPNAWRFGSGQGPGWYVPLTLVHYQYCPYQRNGLVALIKGEPLFVQGTYVENVRRDDLGHVDWLVPPLTCLIKDPGIEARTLALADQALAGTLAA